MPPFRALLFLLLLVSIAPAPAAAVAFTPLWTLSGWDFLQDLGNTDSDAQHELMFASKADGHVAIVDGLTGAIRTVPSGVLFYEVSVNGTRLKGRMVCLGS